MCSSFCLNCVMSLMWDFRLWQESQNRVYLIKELDRITGQVSSQFFSSYLVTLNAISFVGFFLCNLLILGS